MKNIINNFLNALVFLTRIPVKIKNHAILKINYLPLVGLLMAFIIIAAEYLLINFFTVEIRALLLLMLYIYLSGALHLDGLGDFCDGFFAGRDQEKTAAIMHDSNSGIFALVALILVLILKYLLFKELLFADHIEALIIMAVIARFSLAQVIMFANVSKLSVMAEALKANAKKTDLFYCNLITFIILGVYIYFYGLNFCYPILLALVLILALILFLLNWSQKKLGGITGDIYGTIIELGEILFLLALTIYL
ncbi:MAG: adenosylcobinamide-GDP ribazoletransferase [Bacillota bacterium]